jgi:hydroxyacylglutathione hydrolase
MSGKRLEVLSFTAGGFGENAYLCHVPGAATTVAIDPGGDAAAMAAAAEARGLAIEAIVLTHAHIDHIEGVAELARRSGAPIHLHPLDRAWYDRVGEQALMFGVRVEQPPAPDHELADGQRLSVAGAEFDVRLVPGHSPGHVLLYDAAAGIAFVGDVVSQGSIGRSDLPGGDYRQLMDSIRRHVLTLPDDTVLYTGHGPETTVGHERVTNPFLVPQYRGGGLA